MRPLAILSFLLWSVVVVCTLVFVGHIAAEYNHAHGKHVAQQRQWAAYHRTNCLGSNDLLTISAELSKGLDKSLCDRARYNAQVSPRWKALEHTAEHILQHDILQPVYYVYDRYYWLFMAVVIPLVVVGVFVLWQLTLRGPIALFLHAMMAGQGQMYVPANGYAANKQH